MPLLDLKTDLKSLKYGNDRPGGGDSGQPYQQVDINKVDSGFNRFRMTKFDDGLVRGGVVGAANAAVVDTLRIGKFLKDFPKGPLFIVKQIGLQMSNPALETKKLKTDNPTAGGGLLRNVGNFIINTANKIVNAVGPTRIYNLGINTLAQVPVNAFGVHFNRHGLLPVQDEQTKYLAVAQSNNEGQGAPNNRLVGLKSQFRLGDLISSANPQFFTNAQRRAAGQAVAGLLSLATGTVSKPKPIGFLDANKELTVSRYIGGPGSVYGIGTTTILRKVFTEDSGRIDKAKTQSSILAGKTKNDNGDVQNVILKGTFDFKISNQTNSSLASNSFDLLNAKINNSFLNLTGSINDYHGINKDNQQRGYNNATNKIRTSLGFVGASTKTSSSFIPNKLPDLTDFGSIDEYKRNTLDDKNASVTDISSSIGIKNRILQTNKDLGVSKQYFSGSSIETSFNLDTTTYSQTVTLDLPLSVDSNNNVTTPSANKGKTPISNASYSVYQRIVDSRKLRETTYSLNGNQVNAFGIYSSGSSISLRDTLGDISPNSTQLPVYSNGKKVIRIGIPWNKVNRELRIGSGLQDQINLTPIFDQTGYWGGDVIGTHNIRDLVRFRIQAIDGANPTSGKWMVFRAYLTDLSDSSNATWNEIKYAGRGDKFYIYDGFTRKINISFKVAALSANEMQFIYQKLNFLMGNTMPDYTENGLMRGPLVRMSVGNWIDGQAGIINDVSLKVPQDSPWEIAIDEPEGGPKLLILPHIIEVSLTFTPIGSETKASNLVSAKSLTTSHIAQNNTGDIKNQYIK